MKVGVAHKLFLVILTAAALSVLSAVLIMQWSLSRGFLKFINTTEQAGVSRMAGKLEEIYRSEQNWEFLKRDPARWNNLVTASMPEVGPPPGDRRHEGPPPDPQGSDYVPPDHRPGDNHGPVPPHIARYFDQRLSLLDSSKTVLIRHEGGTFDRTLTALMFQGSIVGYLGLSPRKVISDAPQQRFLREQKLALVLTAEVVVLLAAALSLVLARRLVRPLNELTQATHQLAAGNYAIRVSADSRDELGQLACDFNTLALTLEKSELTRRQWVADISHELRTPLAILRSEIEALQDGIRQPSIEKINSLHGEVMHLARLVDDLYQLSLSDVGALSYRKTELDLALVLEETVSHFRQEFFNKKITLETNNPEAALTAVFGDAERLYQLFSNVLDNSLKYTDSGGRLLVSLQVDMNRIIISFSDSAPSVSAPDLSRLFERLYRVESSRNRSTGGAGLGLAICKNIIEAHSGSIIAQASELGGLCIRIELPGVNS